MADPKKPSKAGYHHGNLRSAMIEAADAIIREHGIEGFSLREAARRAGVSIGAPAHHFGSAKGLLTEVAMLGYASLGEYLNAVVPSDDDKRDLRDLAQAYVRFAITHPGRFRLMFRADLVDREDPRFDQVSRRAMTGLATAIARCAPPGADAMVELFVVWSSMHGMANLAVDGKMKYMFEGADAERFAREILPGVLESAWPFGKA